MGCCHSAEAVSAGVGRPFVLLLGRQHAGKARLFAALGKRDWETTYGSRAPTVNDQYSAGGVTMYKYNVGGVSESALAGVLRAKVADLGADNVTVWYMFDDGAPDLPADLRELARLCDVRELAGIPIWVVVATRTQRAYDRYAGKTGRLRMQDLLGALGTRSGAAAADTIMRRVVRVIRVMVPPVVGGTSGTSGGGGGSGGKRPGIGESVAAASGAMPTRLEQLRDALAGGGSTTVA